MSFNPDEPRDQGGKWTGGGGARGRAKTKWLTVNVAKRNSAGAAEPHDVAVNPTDDDIRDMLRDNPVDMLRAIKDEKGNVYVTAGDLLHAQMKNVLRREHGVVPSGEVSIIGQNENHRPMMISGGDEYSDWIRADAFDPDEPRADAKLKLALSLLDGISQYIRADWDESQHPRGQPENAGEFAKGGGAAAPKAEGGKGYEFVSPNIQEGTHLKEARIGIKSARHKFITNVAEEVDKALGLKPITRPVIGVWSDGAENSTMSVYAKPPSWNELVASAAMKGWLAKQKQVLIFKEGETDPKHGDDAALATFRASGDAAGISQYLADHGLIYHTLQPISDGGFAVHVYGNDEKTGHAVAEAGEHYGSEVTVHEGRGAFLGTVKEDGSADDQRADAREVYSRLLGELGDEKVNRAWASLRDRYGRQADQVISDQTDTPHFKAWFGKSKIVDQDGQPQVMYHGTLGDFTSFDKSRANVQSNWGAGFYFTNDRDDMSHNYADIGGPDPTHKLESMAEEIEDQDDFEGDHEEAKRRASKLMAVQHEGAAVPVFLKMEQPFKIGGKDETHLDFDEHYDEKSDEYGEPTGKAVELVQAIRDITKNGDYFDTKGIDEATDALLEEARDSGGLQASKLEDIARKSSGLVYMTDENGKFVWQDVVRKALHKIGYDGIIDTRVSQKWSFMKLKPTTAHYIVFDPHQIKSAIGNKGTFDPKSTKITDSMYAHDAYNPNEARIPKGEPGAGQWTSGGGGMGFTKGEPAEGDPEGTEVWQHAGTGGKLTVKPNGAWYFNGGKSNAYEGYGGNEESLNKFINENREIFKPSKPKEAGDPAKEGPDIIDAVSKLGEAKVKDLGLSGSWHTFMVGEHTDSADDFVFHVNPTTGEYSWKPPKTTEAVKGNGLRQFLDDMKGTRAFGDRAEKLIAALPKPPTEWTPNQAAWEVGGNEWNRKTGERLEKEFVAVAPELDAIVEKLYKGKEPVPGTPEDEEEEETSTPTEWDELSSDQQEEAEQKWTSANYDSFHDSNVQNWYDNGEALHSAKVDLANEGSDAPYVDETIDEFLNDWANDPDDPKPVPYTKAQLIAATDIAEYEENNYDGSADPEITFNDDELKNPTDLAYDPEKQGVLPGMERPDVRDHFTKEMREDLKDRLVTAFNKQADKDSGDVEAPEYIDESTKEDLGNYWDQMDDDAKFEQAKDSLDLEDAKPDKPKVEALDHPPRKYDPFNFHPGTDDYKRTQHLSHALSIQRATDVLMKRGLLKAPPPPITAESVAKDFTEAQAKWVEGSTDKVLNTLLMEGANLKDVSTPETKNLLTYAYDTLYSGPVENVAYGGDWTKSPTAGIEPGDAEIAAKQFAVKLVHAADLSGPQVTFNKSILAKELTPHEREVFDKYENKIAVDMAATHANNVQREQGRHPDAGDQKAKVNEIDSKMWRDWVGSSTSFGGKMIQIGSADEFGGHLRIPPGPKLEPEPITEATTADAIKGFGDRNSTENADLRNAIQAHLREETSKPAVLRKLPSDALKWNLIPAVVQDSLKLSLGKDGDVKVDFDTETMAPAALRAVEAIKLHLDRAIRRGIEQRREDMNVTRRVLAEEDAKLKFGGYKPISEDAAIEDMQALPSPNQMREAFAKTLSFVGPTDGNVQYELSKRLANNTFWRPAITKKDGKWFFDPAKLDVAGAAMDPTFPNKTEHRDMLDEPTAREQLATAAREGFDNYMKWRNYNLKNEATKVYDDAKKEEWEPKEELIKQADQKYAEIGGYAGVKALMRAKWETTQWLMAKAGIHEFSAYRGILDPQVNDADIEKVPVKGSDGRDYVKLPGYTMLRNGAASTALKASVSNNWHSWKGGDKDRVVLRIRMPRTAAISVPSYGQNNAAEREVIVTGTAWKNWDAYKQTAPEFDVIPIEHHAEAPEGEDTATTSEAPQLKEAA